jgi:hypothetical protein
MRAVNPGYSGGAFFCFTLGSFLGSSSADHIDTWTIDRSGCHYKSDNRLRPGVGSNIELGEHVYRCRRKHVAFLLIYDQFFRLGRGG